MNTILQRRGFLTSFLGTIAIGLCFLFVSPLEAAEEIRVLDLGEGPSQAVPPDWELTTHHGTADLTMVRETIGPVLKFYSNSSSFSVQKETSVDLRRTPWLTWEWKVTALPEGGNFTDPDVDDQCAQLILAFSKRFWQMRKTVAYLWGNESPEGTMGNTAAGSLLPMLQMKAVVVRSGKRDVGKWISETRNVVEDYKQLYGKEPEGVVGVRIQINSQHTGTKAESYWRRVAFKSTP